jgi:catechol 2,3-dioxygenase-like lactoylglutathione lyase family enzyme
MGKITVTRTYHIEIPVNDIERAEKFYVDVLGMKIKGRGAGEMESNRPFFEQLGYWPENLRLATAKGDMEVVLFERPKPIERDWQEDSLYHTVFSTSKEDFDRAFSLIARGVYALQAKCLVYLFDIRSSSLSSCFIDRSSSDFPDSCSSP